MNNSSRLNWYVVYTKSKWEKKVAQTLQKREVEHYCPLNKVRKQWHDRKKMVMEPLFSSYVFVCAEAQQLNYIKELPGIVNFVHWLGRPAIVRAEEIQAVKDFLCEHDSVAVEKINVNMHDKVRITKGPFMHQEGKIVQLTNNTVKVELPSIGYALIASISKAHIVLSAAAQPIQSSVPSLLIPPGFAKAN